MANAFETEMPEESLGRAVGHGTPRRALSPADLDPSDFHQRVDSSPRKGDAPDVLDLRPRYGLVIGDYGQSLDRRPRQPALFGLFLPQQEREIWRSSELPFFGDPNEGYASSLIDSLKSREDGRNVGALRERCCQ